MNTTDQGAVASTAELGLVPERAVVAYLYHDAQTPEDAHPWLHSTMLVLAADRRPKLRNETALVTLAQAESMVAEERERCSVLLIQRDSLRDALRKVLDAGNAEAKARMSWQNARENFSSSSHEAKQHERAMLAASDAEREARVLLLTLKA